MKIERLKALSSWAAHDHLIVLIHTGEGVTGLGLGRIRCSRRRCGTFAEYG